MHDLISLTAIFPCSDKSLDLKTSKALSKGRPSDATENATILKFIFIYIYKRCQKIGVLSKEKLFEKEMLGVILVVVRAENREKGINPTISIILNLSIWNFAYNLP